MNGFRVRYSLGVLAHDGTVHIHKSGWVRFKLIVKSAHLNPSLRVQQTIGIMHEYTWLERPTLMRRFKPIIKS